MLMDSARSDRPQLRTAFFGRELGRFKIEIAALTETRLAEVGEIKEVGAGYTLFWSGPKSEERREAGVGFAINTDLFDKLVGTGHHTFEGVIGSEGIGKCNSDGLLLLRKCAEHDLLITKYDTKPQQYNMDASSFQTLASHWLCHNAEERQTWCQSDNYHVWSRLLDRSQTGCSKPNST